MGKLIVVLLIAAAVYGGARHFGYLGRTLETRGPPGTAQTVVAEVEGGKVTYTVNGPAEETYMVFGGDTAGGSFSHASLTGIELAVVRRIAKRYPDFNRCDSAGAPEAIRSLESVQVVADRAVLAKLAAAVKDAESRQKARGERLCASVQGQWLTLEKMEKGELVVTGEQYGRMVPGNAIKQYFLHLQSLDARDCRDWM